MAKIIYGIQSDGMGHALRSKPILDHLISKGHRIKILTSGKSYDFMKKHFKDVEEIHFLSFYYYNNKVSFTLTLLKSLLGIKDIIFKGFLRANKMMRDFNPDIVISDFEIFSSRSALFNKKPLISIDNITMVNMTRVPYRLSEIIDYILTKLMIDIFTFRSGHYFITSFFSLPLCSKHYEKKVTIVPPILRQSIIDVKRKASYKDHILVYQTTNTNKQLIPSLLACKDTKFIYYGCNEDRKQDNITFRKFSEEGFIDDFASAKGVITNGGFTLISEAVYLHKPMLCNPIHRQFEQNLNARIIEEKGYGMNVSVLSPENVSSFIKSLKRYKKNLASYEQDSNKVLFKALDKEISIALERR